VAVRHTLKNLPADPPGFGFATGKTQQLRTLLETTLEGLYRQVYPEPPGAPPTQGSPR